MFSPTGSGAVLVRGKNGATAYDGRRGHIQGGHGGLEVMVFPQEMAWRDSHSHRLTWVQRMCFFKRVSHDFVDYFVSIFLAKSIVCLTFVNDFCHVFIVSFIIVVRNYHFLSFS